MNILMITNTYKPFTSGVSRSIVTFTACYRKLGHKVLIVAPSFPDQEEESEVIRVPTIQNFNGTDFSVGIPIPFSLNEEINKFNPAVIHSHHPFLLGNTALRLAATFEIPLIYTFHTFYEKYTHYAPGAGTEALKYFVGTLAAGYANLSDQIIAPSHYVALELARKGVTKPIDVIPTGIDLQAIATGEGKRFRNKYSIPEKAFVVGFVSRLAEEKNIGFLMDAVLQFMESEEHVYFVIAGTGPLEASIKERIEAHANKARISLVGIQLGQDLFDCYHAMNVFAFASQSETQGLVVTEAMAAGLPVVAVKASGIDEVVQDKVNGRLLETENIESFVSALEWIFKANKSLRNSLIEAAHKTAERLSDENCALRALKLYEDAKREAKHLHEKESSWNAFIHTIETEWNILANMGKAAQGAISKSFDESPAELSKSA